MVNKSMSNLGIRLANSGAKPLQTNNQNRGMVGPGGLEPRSQWAAAIQPRLCSGRACCFVGEPIWQERVLQATARNGGATAIGLGVAAIMMPKDEQSESGRQYLGV